MTSSLLPFGRSRETIQDQEFLVVALQDQLVGISAKSILELIEQPAVQAIPNPPEFVAGVLNLRGEILSVLDLEAAFCGELFETRSQIAGYAGVIVQTNKERICFLVPKVLGIFSIKPETRTTEFPFIPRLNSICSIREIALTPLIDPAKEEIVLILDIEIFVSNRSAEWDFSKYEKLSLSSRAIDLSKLTEEELSQLDLIAHDSFFERQEKLRHLQLDDFLLIQIGDFNLGIPLPFVQQALLTKLIEKNEDKFPILGWINLEDIDIPVIDPRELLFTELPPQRPTDYAIFTLSSEQITLGLTVDYIHSVLKASLADPKEIQDELTQFDCLNHLLIENIAYPILDDEISSIPILNISKLIQVLLDNKTVSNSLLAHSKLKNEPKTKDNSSTD